MLNSNNKKLGSEKVVVEKSWLHNNAYGGSEVRWRARYALISMNIVTHGHIVYDTLSIRSGF